MTTPEDMAFLSRKELLALVAELQCRVSVLQKQVTELSTRNQALAAENDQLQRSAQRQATPFSKGTRTREPRRPGLKPAQGTFSFRQAPRPEDITGPPVAVAVSQECCPGCGSELTEERVDLVYVTELPLLPQPRVTQYRVWVCRCTGCGRKVCGEHPGLAPDQYGATAHRVGPRAMAAAHALHYQVGVPVRKVPLVLALLTGLELTQGAITQDALRQARGRVGQKYQELRTGVGESPVVYTDDTGWKVGGDNAHLMAFDTEQATVYQVRPRHRHQEVQEVVPANYRGVMVTDRGRSYEAHSFSRVKQQKCLAHLQKTLSTLLEKKRVGPGSLGRTSRCCYGWRWTSGRSTTLGRQRTLRAEPQSCDLSSATCSGSGGLRDPDNRHLLQVLRRYHQRGELLRFLEDPCIEPTNNRVERALRPAVIARKVSQCSKTWSGAVAFVTFTSVIQTLLKKGSWPSVVEALADLFRAPQSQTTTPCLTGVRRF